MGFKEVYRRNHLFLFHFIVMELVYIRFFKGRLRAPRTGPRTL
jgi:hypothetical protein